MTKKTAFPQYGQRSVPNPPGVESLAMTLPVPVAGGF
jgi:hypothetical protein